MRALTLSIADEPPREFRIFRAGENPTTKGMLYFGAEEAAAVMERFAQEGVDLMIDLNHDAVNEEVIRARADATDAMGWCRLELRGGELWAVDVKWTDAGAGRIRAKKQRYISPVVEHDDEGHVQAVWNLALVSMPATHAAMPLVAASKGAHKDLTSRVAKYRRAVMAPAQRGARYQMQARQRGTEGSTHADSR